MKSTSEVGCPTGLRIRTGYQTSTFQSVKCFFNIKKKCFQNLQRVIINGLLAALHLHTYTIHGSQLLFYDFEILKEVAPASSRSTDIIHASGAKLMLPLVKCNRDLLHLYSLMRRVQDK